MANRSLRCLKSPRNCDFEGNKLWSRVNCDTNFLRSHVSSSENIRYYDVLPELGMVAHSCNVPDEEEDEAALDHTVRSYTHTKPNKTPHGNHLKRFRSTSGRGRQMAEGDRGRRDPPSMPRPSSLLLSSASRKCSLPRYCSSKVTGHPEKLFLDRDCHCLKFSVTTSILH